MSKTPQKDHHREVFMISGIYEIRNILTNKTYVGSAVNIKGRFRTHKSSLRRNKHYNIKIQNSWNKYGEKNFIFNKILICDKKNLILYE